MTGPTGNQLDGTPPSVLFLAPRAYRESEAWLERMTGAIPPALRTFVSVIHQSSVDPSTLFLGRPTRFGRSWFWMRVLPLAGARRLGMILDETRPAVVLVHYSTTALKYRRQIQQRDIPILVHVHGYDITWSGGGLRGWLHRGPWLRKRFVRLARTVTVIANSEFTATRLVDAGVKRDSIYVRPFGVPVPSAAELNAPRTGIVFAGRLVDFKGPLEALQAFSLIAEEFPEEQLTFAGGGPLENALRQRVVDLSLQGRVLVLGEVSNDQILRLLGSSKLLLMHSRQGEKSRQSEALGVVYLEAMSHGLPIVSARHGGFVDIVDAAQCGILVEPGDIEAQATALRDLLRNAERRSDMGSRGRHYITKHHTFEVEAQAIRSLLNESLR